MMFDMVLQVVDVCKLDLIRFEVVFRFFQMFNGSEAEAYTPKSLRSWIDDHGSTAKGKNKIAITSK